MKSISRLPRTFCLIVPRILPSSFKATSIHGCSWAVLVASFVAFSVHSQVNATSGTLTITSDTTLTEDHFGNIVIAKGDVTLDCAGYSLTGQGSGTGIAITGKSRVTVRNCNVANFEIGIALQGAIGDVLIGNNATGNAVFGICLCDGARNNTLNNNSASANGFAGFVVGNGSVHNSFLGNNASGNAASGFLLYQGATFNTLSGNTATTNGENGFHLIRAQQNILEDNTASNNSLDGFRFDSAAENALSKNASDSNDQYGFALVAASHQNSVTQNTGCGNASYDAFQDPSSTRNVWTDNVFCTSSGI